MRIHEPRLLTAEEIELIHDAAIIRYGGLQDLRIGKRVDDLTYRIDTFLEYKPPTTIADLAALYAETIAVSHIFNDGNKRTAFSAMVEVIELNGFEFDPGESNMADYFVDIAAEKITRERFSRVLANMIKRSAND